MDKDNFEFTLTNDEPNSTGPWRVLMLEGELSINDCSYDADDDDPTYDLCLALAKVKGLVE